MAVRDLEAFVRQQAVLYDPNLDVTPGSPFDVRVIQPLVRRLGTDPFTVDLMTFINDRLNQAFPDLATSEGDALTDLLSKPASLLWDPIVREVRRVRRNLSMQDPASLSEDEADALGSNFLRDRRTGQYARGAARVFVAQPQDISLSPVNFTTSSSGLHFFPRQSQSIRTAEIILNVDAEGLYYFDFNVIAEEPGVSYNVGPGSLVSIANVPSVVKVTNLKKFNHGEDAETPEEYISRLQREIGEKSLVTLRGIAAKLLDAFPEVNRLNVVGFNDPEMQRDVIKGGSLGPVVGGGVLGATIADSEGRAFTRRFLQTEEDFLSLIVGDEDSWVLTVFGAFAGATLVQDLTVRAVINTTTLDVEEQVMLLGESGLNWTLRKKEITLSGIHGGILFPDSAEGTVTIPDDEIHIGGAYDVHVRGSDFDESTLAIDNVTDDQPLLSGLELLVGSGSIELGDYVAGVDYDENDATWQLLETAAFQGYALQILDGVDAGVYRVVLVTQSVGVAARLVLDATLTNPGATLYRWRLFDMLNVDLIDPKETRIDGSDLRTVQGSSLVDTASGLDFSAYGVAEGDVLRIIGGDDAGDYALIADPIAPSFDKLEIDSDLTKSSSNLDFVVFRPNAAGGVTRPLIRIKSVELLDSSNQPLGSTIPYAKPVDVQSRAFQNPARGVKWDLYDARLGLVSAPTSSGSFTMSAGQTLVFLIDGVQRTVTFSAGGLTLAATIAEINAQLISWHPEAAVQVGDDRFGIRPRYRGVCLVDGSARIAVFGDRTIRTTFDVHSDTISLAGGWGSLEPAVDYLSRLDVLQILDGWNIGYPEAPYLAEYDATGLWTATNVSTALIVGHELPADPANVTDFRGAGFSPEVLRHVQLGARSLGSARLFFLEPTSFEVDADSRFSVTVNSTVLNFLPDPTLTYQKLPSLPAGVQAGDGSSTDGGNRFTAASQDFQLSSIREGDQLVITTVPLEGTVTMGTVVSSLVNKTLIFSLSGGPDRTLTFIRDDPSLNPDEVSRSGVAAQINAIAGDSICEVTTAGMLRFTTEMDLIVRGEGTANSLILGTVAGTAPAETFVGVDQNNQSPHAGTYTIELVAITYLDVDTTFPGSSPFTSPISLQNFEVHRQGVQRVTATSMADNEGEASLYYFDVELISEGTGDSWNIDADLQLSATGYRSDGYYLEVEDDNLTFSTAEQVGVVLSRTILENGVDDDPVNATNITGQNLQITYDHASVVSDVQSFITSDVERVVCSSPLGRHLIPHFVRFDLSYVGGSKTSVVTPELESHIRKLYPVDPLDSSDIQKVVLDRGASYIANPLNLIAVVHNVDRTVTVARSQDSLTTGRLAAFIPDVLNVTRSAS